MGSVTPALRVENLSLRFPTGTRALNGVSFSLSAGERGIVAGPNGAGKTVLGKCLAGLLRPSEGSIWVSDRPPGFDSTTESAVGLVFQNPDHQIVGQTVWEDARFGPENLGLAIEEIDARAEASLRVMGLLDRRNEDPYRLSGGERRRLAIAGVLALRPRLLFLDEPFSGLDYPSLKALLSTLDSPELGELPVLVATHEIETYYHQAGRLLVLREGHLLFDGDPQEGLPHFESWDLRPMDRMNPMDRP